MAQRTSKEDPGKAGRLSGRKGFAAVLAFWAKRELKWITEIFGNLSGGNILCPSPGAFIYLFFADDYNSSDYLEAKRNEPCSV